MNDAFLVLAQAAKGLSCFFVPRVLDDGTRNAFAIARLKNKLGNRSNASAEVEFDGTHGWLVGDEGDGIARIVEMVNYTRMDCALGSAALVRAARRSGHPSRDLSPHLRTAARRSSAHAERARRSCVGIGGCARALHARRARDRRIGARPRSGRAQTHRDRAGEILRLQAGAGGRCARRSNASAETATSRSRSCRASTARLP